MTNFGSSFKSLQPLPGDGVDIPVVEQDQAGETDKEGQVKADEADSVAGPKVGIFHMRHGLQERMLQEVNLGSRT